MTDDSAHPEEKAASGGSSGPSVRLIVLVVLVVIAVALAVDNRQDVTIGWLFGDSTAPLALALALTFVLGVGVGWLGARHRAR